MSTERKLRECSEAFFDAFAANAPAIKMLHYFSTTSPTFVQHTPVECPHPLTSRVAGINAVRSYFDLLATHWTRSGANIRDELEVDAASRRVIIPASVTWKWRQSGRAWREDFIWTLGFDESFKISSFIVRTMSGGGTCIMRAVDSADTEVMRAVDTDSAAAKVTRICAQASVSSSTTAENCVY